MLELRNISAGYDAGTVLQDVSITVPDGAVVALLGPNGAGKTTTLKVASGMLGTRSGQILIDGEDVTNKAPYQLARRGLCHVPEGRGIFPSLSVTDNIRLQAPARNFKASLGNATAVFPRLGERAKQISRTMSGGEQQMLALAHAYVSDPQYILLDEVSMGLAPKIVEEIFEYLHDLAGQGKSMLLVEQYVGQALKLADYVYIMDRGTITFAGEPGEISEETIMNSYLGSLAS
ncbi:MAG: branched-chain amino acid transport system ATP-binding protein [Actinomycetota bacterium]|nr:branched-chain amino acid transport system ATP-binding protein [Actinomycetota bacterium]